MRCRKASRRSVQRDTIFRVSMRELSSASAGRSSDRLVQFGETLGRAYVVPFAAVHFARYQAARHRSAQQWSELSLAPGFTLAKSDGWYSPMPAKVHMVSPVSTTRPPRSEKSPRGWCGGFATSTR